MFDGPAFYIALGVLSVGTLVGTIWLLPRLLAELPVDFLVSDVPWNPPSHPIRNAIGVVLILAGVAMLVLPGQGILAIIAGLALTNFPGKNRALRWLMRNRTVVRAVNAMRARAGALPLERSAD